MLSKQGFITCLKYAVMKKIWAFSPKIKATIQGFEAAEAKHGKDKRYQVEMPTSRAEEGNAIIVFIIYALRLTHGDHHVLTLDSASSLNMCVDVLSNEQAIPYKQALIEIERLEGKVNAVMSTASQDDMQGTSLIRLHCADPMQIDEIAKTFNIIGKMLGTTNACEKASDNNTDLLMNTAIYKIMQDYLATDRGLH